MKSTRDEPRFYIQNKQYPELFVKKFNMLSESDYCSIETYISNVRSHPLNFSTQNENFLNELFKFIMIDMAKRKSTDDCMEYLKRTFDHKKIQEIKNLQVVQIDKFGPDVQYKNLKPIAKYNLLNSLIENLWLYETTLSLEYFENDQVLEFYLKSMQQRRYNEIPKSLIGKLAVYEYCVKMSSPRLINIIKNAEIDYSLDQPTSKWAIISEKDLDLVKLLYGEGLGAIQFSKFYKIHILVLQ